MQGSPSVPLDVALVITHIFRGRRFLLFALKGRWILAGGGTHRHLHMSGGQG